MEPLPACRALLTVTCLPFLAGRPYPLPFSSLPSCLPAVAVSRRRMPPAWRPNEPRPADPPRNPATLPLPFRAEPAEPPRASYPTPCRQGSFNEKEGVADPRPLAVASQPSLPSLPAYPTPTSRALQPEPLRVRRRMDRFMSRGRCLPTLPLRVNKNRIWWKG